MITIRKEQLAAFQRYASEMFEKRVQTHLLGLLPDALHQMTPSDLRSLVDLGRNKSLSYGIDDAEGTARFIAHMIRFGRDFDRRWAAGILCNPHLTAGEKLARLDQRAAAKQ
jgi:hypothetical protein